MAALLQSPALGTDGRSPCCDVLEDDILTIIFRFLSMHGWGALACSDRRWNNIGRDEGWKPTWVTFAWGVAGVNGLREGTPHPRLLEFAVRNQIVKVACANKATFALASSGRVWFWGRSWCPRRLYPDVDIPTVIDTLKDVTAISCSPPGYFHGRAEYVSRMGYSCAAVTRSGELYTWGMNRCGQLLHAEEIVPEPKKVGRVPELERWNPSVDRVRQVACGLQVMLFEVERSDQQLQTALFSAGVFVPQSLQRSSPREIQELQGKALLQLESGCFHAFALTVSKQLYAMGHPWGQDGAEGNLLGVGPRSHQQWHDANGGPPALVPGHEFVEVRCSSYTTLAITESGQVFTWGDGDGKALGHRNGSTDTPQEVRELLQEHRITHGALAYTNGVAATARGRLFKWGGELWEGGICAPELESDMETEEEDRHQACVREVRWSGLPECYQLEQAAIGHLHGFLIFKKQPLHEGLRSG